MRQALRDAHKDAPLFPTTIRKTKKLTTRGIHVNDVCRMMKRRLKDAGLPEKPYDRPLESHCQLLTMASPHRIPRRCPACWLT